MQIDALMGEMDSDAPVNEFAQARPIPEIAGTAVDLVDDEAVCLLRSEHGDQPVKHRSSPLGGAHLLFKPFCGGEASFGGVFNDFPLLFLKRNSFLSLAGCGDADVCVV